MELEKLQVVLEIESSAVNAQIEAVKNQLSGIGSVANTASKAMSGSFGGLVNIFANMGIGSAMSKNIRNGMQAANSAIKSEMAKISTAMTTATAAATAKTEQSMKNMAESMTASMDKVAERKIEVQVDMSAALAGIQELKSQIEQVQKNGAAPGNMLQQIREAEARGAAKREQQLKDLQAAQEAIEDLVDVDMDYDEDGAGNPTAKPSAFLNTANDLPKMQNAQRFDTAAAKAASVSMPDGVPKGGKYDSDDDVQAIRELKSSFDAVRTELSKLVSNDAKSNGKDEGKEDNESFKQMNSILKNISEDTAAIRTRMASGIASSIPGGVAATGKAAIAGAAGGAAGDSVLGRIPMMLIAAIAASGYIIKDSIKSAMDAVESDSMFSTVFGKQAAGMKQWSEGAGTGQAAMYQSGSQAGAIAPKDLGLDPVALRENSAYLYSMTTAMGLASAPARQMSQDLSMLANDMASFYNISSDEAFTKLRGGISGETEGLKSLGVVVNETAVKQYAYTHGIARQGAELNESQKAMARYNIIMNSTSMAQGDLARTINSPSNQLRVLRTNLEMVKRSLGEAFMPIVAVVLPILNSFMRGLNTVLKYVGAFMRILFGKPAGASGDGGAKAMAAGYDAVGTAAEGAGTKAEKAKGSLAGFDEINSISMSSPSGGGAGGAGGGGGISIPEVSGDGIFNDVTEQMDMYEAKVRAFLDKAQGWLPLIAGVAAGFAVLWTASHWTKIIGAVEALAGKFSLLSPILTPLVTGMKAVGTVIGGLGTGPILLCIAAVVALIAIITDLWKNSSTFRTNMIIVWDAVKNAFVTAWGMIWNGGLKPLIAALQELWVQFQAIYLKIRPILEFFITGIIAIGGAVVAAVALIIGLIVKLAINIVQFVVDVIAAILKCINWIVDNWSAMWNKVGKYASDAWAGIKSVFSGIGTWFGNAFAGAWNAIKGAFSGVGSFFGGIWDTIKSKFTSVGTSIGSAVSGAFKTVMNGAFSTIESRINNFIRMINNAIWIINKIPGVNISNVKELSIPRLARGGIIDSPTVAMVGEAGREAVMPLENNTGWINELASKINSQGNGGSDRPLELILQVGSTQLGRVVVDSLNKLSRQEGRLALNI